MIEDTLGLMNRIEGEEVLAMDVYKQLEEDVETIVCV